MTVYRSRNAHRREPSTVVMMLLMALCLASSAATGVTFLLAILYTNVVLFGVCVLTGIVSMATLFVMVGLSNR